jgi:hypothetical protein
VLILDVRLFLHQHGRPRVAAQETGTGFARLKVHLRLGGRNVDATSGTTTTATTTGRGVNSTATTTATTTGRGINTTATTIAATTTAKNARTLTATAATTGSTEVGLHEDLLLTTTTASAKHGEELFVIAIFVVHHDVLDRAENN